MSLGSHAHTPKKRASIVQGRSQLGNRFAKPGSVLPSPIRFSLCFRRALQDRGLRLPDVFGSVGDISSPPKPQQRQGQQAGHQPGHDEGRPCGWMMRTLRPCVRACRNLVSLALGRLGSGHGHGLDWQICLAFAAGELGAREYPLVIIKPRPSSRACVDDEAPRSDLEHQAEANRLTPTGALASSDVVDLLETRSRTPNAIR